MPGNKEKANLKLQIRNTEEELMLAMDLVDDIADKLAYLKTKLHKMTEKNSSGKNKKPKS